MRFRILIILLLSIAIAYAQRYYTEVAHIPNSVHGKIPYLNHLLVRPYPMVINDDQYKVYFFVETMYDYLQFVVDEEKYTSAYQVEVNLLNEDSKETYSQSWNSTVSLADFHETNRRDRYHLTLDSINIPPGRYDINLNYKDLQGKQQNEVRLKLNLEPIKDIHASLPIFLDKEDDDNQFYGMLPHRPLALRNHIPFNKPLSVFLSSYVPKDSTISIKLQIFSTTAPEQKYAVDTTLVVHNSRATCIVTPPFTKWKEGNYLLSVKYATKQDSLNHKLPFEIIWFWKPRSLMSLDYAYRPLELITSPEEFKKIKSGSKRERQSNFDNYWQQKDPTPHTAFNEVLFEFFTRVDSVDITWGGRRKLYGWHKDPGRIYLLYGQPDKVEDQSLNPEYPYLKWIYYKSDHNLIFVFKALDGRKNYLLVDEIEE